MAPEKKLHDRILRTVTSETILRSMDIGYGFHAFRSLTTYTKKNSLSPGEHKWQDEKQGFVDDENLQLMLADDEYNATRKLVMVPDHIFEELGEKPFHEVIMHPRRDTRMELVSPDFAWEKLAYEGMCPDNVMEVRGYDHTLRRPDGSILRCAEECNRRGFIGGADEDHVDLFDLAELYAQRDDVFFRREGSQKDIDRYTLPANPDSLRQLAVEPPYWERNEDDLPSGIRVINVLWRPSQEDYEAVFAHVGERSGAAFCTAWLALLETGPRLQETPVAQRIAERLEEKEAQRAGPKP